VFGLNADRAPQLKAIVRLHLLVRFDNRTSPPFRGSSYRH
jgi:hypothetical protein